MARRGQAKVRYANSTSPASHGKPWEVVDRHDRLEVHFSTARDHATQRVNITPWKRIGLLYRDLAEAFARKHAGSTPQTRRTAARGISDRFVSFLAAEQLSLDARSDIQRDLLVRYLTHLDAYAAEFEIASHSKLHYWRFAATLIEEICAREPTIELDVPHRPFAGTNFAPKNIRAPDHHAISKTLAVCATEALRTIDTVDAFAPRLRDARERIAAGDKWNTGRIEDVAAEVLRRYGIMPPRRDLVGTVLWKAIEPHGYSELRRLIHPVANDLLPFFLLMAAHSGWNQQPLAHLKLSGCGYTTLLGVKRFTINAPKFRAGSVARRSFALTGYPLSPHEIVEFVLRWTAVLRESAPESVRDDVWLHYVSAAGSNTYKRVHIDSLAMRHKSSVVNPTPLLMYFCEQHGLKFTGVREMRLAFAERVADATGGDMLALRELLGHRNVATTNSHYRTTAMQRSGAEAIAGVQATRERWISSDGRVDARSRGPTKDRTAATPGFVCLDPFDSPLASQAKGKLCGAYGKCPSCPLATVDPDHVYALARFLQVHEKYLEAREVLGRATWEIKFAEDVDRISNHWIPALATKKNLDNARRLLLPPLPDLE